MDETIRKNSASESDETRKAATDSGCGEDHACDCVDRRNFIKILSLGTALATGVSTPAASASEISPKTEEAKDELLKAFDQGPWPVLKRYPQSHLARIALPLGGIGTGTISLGGRGDLRDWEIMNRSAKGFVPNRADAFPFFALFTQTSGGKKTTRVLEGPIETSDYEGSHGSAVPNDGLPRFRDCRFAAAYPLGQVLLSDPEIPVDVLLQAFNPLIPGDADASGIPVAVLRYTLRNRTDKPVRASVCGNLPNFIGVDGWETEKDWKGDPVAVGAKGNRNQLRQGEKVQGIFMDSTGVDPKKEAWGTMALAVSAESEVTYRADWSEDAWSTHILDYWDDFSADGRLVLRDRSRSDMPMASLSVSLTLPPHGEQSATFIIAWHFPNRTTWTPKGKGDSEEDRIGNYYAAQYTDAWDVAEKTAARLDDLEKDTVVFVRAFCASSLPEEVKEAALFNLSTLRSQTCFRTPDGKFFGWEGLCNNKGCCYGSCTHVWNYEQATAFLFGSLAMKMREVEFGHATDDTGLMSFRVNLPLSRAREFGKGAADGQMGCIMKMYRDWQLSGDDAALKTLWPRVRKSLEFCWIRGGWDADRDGVMEGCQHNTMDVEYYGPNPQMGGWYLGALRAAEAMARHVGDTDFASTCRGLFERGKQWIDEHLFNGEYYEQEIRPPKDKSDIAPALLVGMGSKDLSHPDFQLGSGCLVDQLVGQFMAHVCGLGYLLKPENVRKTLQSVLKYNRRESLENHFNNMRSFALGQESALLMAGYPKDRPQNPFPYYNEVMTGFEYAAAVGLLYEEEVEKGLECIRDIRERYDGLKRNPFNEAECGHHYARAMASWAAVLALTGFQYSGVEKTMTFAPREGAHFWSNGYAWGTCSIKKVEDHFEVDLQVAHGELSLVEFRLRRFGGSRLETPEKTATGRQWRFRVTHS